MQGLYIRWFISVDDHFEEKKYSNFVLPPLTAFFGHTVQNIFFALIKKIFLQTLVEIIFRFQKFFYRKNEQNEKFYIKGCVEFIFEGIFWKY